MIGSVSSGSLFARLQSIGVAAGRIAAGIQSSNVSPSGVVAAVIVAWIGSMIGNHMTAGRNIEKSVVAACTIVAWMQLTAGSQLQSIGASNRMAAAS